MRTIPLKPRQRRSPNRLLQALSPREYAAILPHMRRVALAVGEIVSEPHARPLHVHFPETAVFSLVTLMSTGAGVEAATVGNEGVVGLSAVLGPGTMSTRCLAQIAGGAQRISVAALRRVVAEYPSIGATLLRYAQVFINQLAQSVACNRLHPIEQRCARWLLMTHDRIGGGDVFYLTQEFLSYMLGVRREGVSVASQALQRGGMIRYRRGHVSILDRPSLELASCECYGATSDDYRRLLK